jgi:electron transport complex protein RnfG
MTETKSTWPPNTAEPGSIRLISTLGVAGFLSGLILVSAYVITKPRIEKNKEEALQAAIYHVIPGCATYDVLTLDGGRLIKRDKSTAEAKTGKRIFVGYDSSGAVKGFAIPASESGFQDVINLIYGFEAQQNLIIGFEVLDSKETPGLGDKIIKDEHFLSNFTALAVESSIEAAKPGTKNRANQVETITGATISSKAVIRALQKSLEEWRPAIRQYVQDRAMTSGGTP